MKQQPLKRKNKLQPSADSIYVALILQPLAKVNSAASRELDSTF